MLTDRDLEKRAEEMAFCDFFCNVGEEDWPEDPWKLLDAGELFSDDGEHCLVVWYPFENETVEEISTRVTDATDVYFEHLKWARDNAA